MKRLILSAFVVSVVAAATSAANAIPSMTASKATLCHRTASATKPYVQITVSTKGALQGHLRRHPADIHPVPAGGCPAVALSPSGGGTVLTASMSGANEVPDPGDPDGSGTAQFRMTRGAAVICFQISAQAITLPAAAAHIHSGAAGVPGPIVVPLTAPGANGTSNGCVNSTRAVVAAILDSPAGYYANVHTTDYPGGAIRGQLTA
jgi:hypothetical protein